MTEHNNPNDQNEPDEDDPPVGVRGRYGGQKPYREAWEKYFDELIEDPIVEPELPATPEDALTATEGDELRSILEEIYSRENESLALYEPLPEQQRFHESLACERIIIGGHRGGKTLCECVEIARAITGQDPYGKYSQRDGRAIAVGPDLVHLSKVIYRKLFRPGAFWVIHDPELGRMRAFRPYDPADQARAKEAKEAPPLVPTRFYKEKDVSWENKRESVPKSIRLNTGWELSFFTANSAPPNGWDASIAIFDEEIADPEWYPEVAARLIDRRKVIGPGGFFRDGRFWWGATPKVGTAKLWELSERAANCAGETFPVIEQFNINLFDNPHMSDEAKAEFVEKMSDNEDDYNVRVLGLFAIAGSRVYPEFSPHGAHGCPSFAIPDEWTRVIALDPGRQVCAVLFCAIPPPHVQWIDTPDGKQVRVKGRKFLYDELYIRKASAKLVAERLKQKIGRTRLWQGIIDNQAGRMHEIGSGVTHEQQYSKAFKAAGITFDKTVGQAFTWGASDIDSGVEAVRAGLHVDGDGYSEWAVMWEKLPKFLWEAKRYTYKKIPGTNVASDKPYARDSHLMDCWRYLAMAQLKWIKPKMKAQTTCYTTELIKAKKARAKAKKMSATDGGSVKLW